MQSLSSPRRSLLARFVYVKLFVFSLMCTIVFFAKPAAAQTLPAIGCASGVMDPAAGFGWSVLIPPTPPEHPYDCTIRESLNSDKSEDILINQPIVNDPSFVYAQIKFQPGDQITITADGCVQRGGQGSTWFRYVNPPGAVPGVPITYQQSPLYYGTISIPFATTQGGWPLQAGGDSTMTPLFELMLPRPGATTIDNVINIAPLSEMPDGALSNIESINLTLGYVDSTDTNAYTDNGYWNQDNGPDNQCVNNLPDENTQPPPISTIDPAVPQIYGAWGGPAWINLHVVHNANVGYTAAVPHDWDVVATQWDVNGFPLNPAWGWQILNQANRAENTPAAAEAIMKKFTWPTALSSGPEPASLLP